MISQHSCQPQFCGMRYTSFWRYSCLALNTDLALWKCKSELLSDAIRAEAHNQAAWASHTGIPLDRQTWPSAGKAHSSGCAHDLDFRVGLTNACKSVKALALALATSPEYVTPVQSLRVMAVLMVILVSELSSHQILQSRNAPAAPSHHPSYHQHLG